MKIYNIISNVIQKQNFLLLFSSMVISRGMEFFLKIILGRLLSPEQLGAIQQIDTYLEIFVVLAVFGLNSALLKYVSEEYDNESIKEKLMTWFIKKGLIISLVITFLLYLLIGMELLPNHDLNNVFFVLLLTIPLLVFAHPSYGLLMSYFNAIRDINKMSTYKIVYYLVLFVLSLSLVYLCGYTAYYITLIVLSLMSFGFAIYYFKPFFLKKITRPINYKEINKYIFFSSLSSSSSIILNNMEVLLVTYLYSQKTLGLYTAAFLIMKSLWVLPLSIMQVESPKISYQYKNFDIDIYKYYNSQIKKMIKINLPIIIVFLLFNKLILQILFGQDYLGISKSLSILLIGTIFYSFTIVGGNIFLATNKVNVNLFLSIPRAASIVLFSLLLKPVFNIQSVAIASCFTYLIFFVLQSFLIKKLYKMYSTSTVRNSI